MPVLQHQQTVSHISFPLTSASAVLQCLLRPAAILPFSYTSSNRILLGGSLCTTQPHKSSRGLEDGGELLAMSGTLMQAREWVTMKDLR